LDERFDAASIGESIARHGFFQSEPLIAIPLAVGEYLVVEGNRRLTALKALADREVYSRMTDPRWKTLGASLGEVVTLDTVIPVLVAPSRESVAPILGYRHVTGITPWDPYQQARYVASLIDDPAGNLSATDVANLIGRDLSEVKSFYRNFSIVEQATDEFNIPDVERVVDEFGVWNRAMTSVGIRDYISAPAPRDVLERSYPLPESSGESLARAITWLFGEPRSDDEKVQGRQSTKGRVISDSRQLTRLGRVLASPEGRAALEEDPNLAAAERAALNPAARFLEGVSTARSSLVAARTNATPELVSDSQELLQEVQDKLNEIRSL